MINQLKIIGITILITAIVTTIIVKRYFPNIKIEIVNSEVGPTIHTPGNNSCEECRDSDINVEGKIDENTLRGKAYDKCKSADFSFELKARSTLKHIIQLGAGWNSGLGYYIKPGYLYNFDLFSLGGSIVLPQNKKDFGVEVMIQKELF